MRLFLVVSWVLLGVTCTCVEYVKAAPPGLENRLGGLEERLQLMESKRSAEYEQFQRDIKYITGTLASIKPTSTELSDVERETVANLVKQLLAKEIPNNMPHMGGKSNKMKGMIKSIKMRGSNNMMRMHKSMKMRGSNNMKGMNTSMKMRGSNNMKGMNTSMNMRGSNNTKGMNTSMKMRGSNNMMGMHKPMKMRCMSRIKRIEATIRDMQLGSNLLKRPTKADEDDITLNSESIMKLRGEQKALMDKLKATDAAISTVVDRMDAMDTLILEQRDTFENALRQLNGMNETTVSNMTDGPDYACLDGWKLFEGSCYMFFDLNFRDTFDGAVEQCSMSGEHIVDITSEDEYNFVMGLTDDSMWIGLNDFAYENDWRRQVNGQKATYTNWARGQPNGGREANCVFVNGGDGKFMYDYDCDRTLSYMCEQDALVQD